MMCSTILREESKKEEDTQSKKKRDTHKSGKDDGQDDSEGRSPRGQLRTARSVPTLHESSQGRKGK